MTIEEMEHFESIRQWVYNHTGLHFPPRKHLSLYQRLKKLCWELDISGLAELDRHLQQRDFPNLPVRIACAVSTNHTYFFREREMMQFFREEIIPTLPPLEPWRIWSAAAASGDEAYSLALILADTLGLERAQTQTAILGTDISQTALQQAEQGICVERRLEKVPAHLRLQYFHAVGLGQWAIDPAIKKMCTFRRLNLMRVPWPFQNRFHVIFSRNVLYYFSRPDQEKLLQRMYEQAEPDGWLITSVTESLWQMDVQWQLVTTGVYRKIT